MSMLLKRAGIIGATLVIAADGVWTGVHTSRHWMARDYWYQLSIDATSFDGLVQDHGGHWAVHNTIVANALTEVTGASYWPFWGVLRLVLWSGLLAVVWRVLTAYKVGPVLALVGVAAVSVISQTAVFSPWLISVPVGLGVWLVLGLLLDGPQTTKRGLACLGTGLLAVTSGSLGVISLVAAVALCAIKKGSRFWLPWLLVPLLVRGLWAVFLVDDAGSSGGDGEGLDLWAIGTNAFDLVVSQVARYVGVSNLVASLLVVGLVGGQLVRAARRRLTTLEILGSVSLVGFAIAASLVRVSAGTAAATGRYMPAVITLVVVTALAGIRDVRRDWAVIAVLPLAAFVFIGQLEARSNTYGFYQQRAQDTRALVTAAAEVVDLGHPYFGQALVGRDVGAGMLTFGQLETYSSNGWIPPSEGDHRAAAQVRTLLLQRPWQGPSSGCVRSDTGIATTDQDVLVSGSPNTAVVVVWPMLADGQPGSRSVALGPSGKTRLRLRFPTEEGVVIRGESDPIELCRRE